jgi:cytochrome c biogenesis protein CcmG, thiol:disulfide interchange protein DsbE
MIRRFAIVASLAAVSACATEDKGAVSDRVEIGARAPAYRAISLAGDSVSIEQQRGKVLLLNVWATWCHPCRTEIPELRAIHDKYKSRGLELVGVSVDSDGADDGIREFMNDFKMNYAIWRDPDERVSSQFLIVGVPATFLIDREGILRWRKTGPIALGDTSLSAAIERALGG